MIEKMKFLSITGPKADIDRMTETYLSRYEIHLDDPYFYSSTGHLPSVSENDE